ncbi:phospholipase D family protein [Salegentibacter mishustinae]|uniref:phospholipase D family protein n=1 Tax=Salegentibacter mishustinae TaxID=270918 RepID=UPI001CE130E9|nr:phospholipase D family protein [Salegentibacter mishustinae]UBZ07257.1 phospholipase D family protein [Salegentibacter mishustinae]
MSAFLTGEELENVVYDIIWDAEKTLLIVSPFIKLDDYFKNLFKKHMDDHKLRIILVFGKNEKKVNRSLSNEDFDFFKQFPNVSIVYVPHLHAKYYGNEKKGVITSINLYDYSFKNNIEFGVFSEQKLFNKLSTSADVEAWEQCMDLAYNNEVVYVKRPAYRSKKGLISFGKEYVKSEVLFDSTDKFYGSGKSNLDSEKRLYDFDDELDLDNQYDVRPERVWEEEQSSTFSKNKINKKENKVDPTNNTQDKEPKKGYCIRTREEIDFNPERPMSNKAFKMWNKYGDKNYQEKFCHFSGEPSNGETSFAKPILRKNWKKAMKN